MMSGQISTAQREPDMFLGQLTMRPNPHVRIAYSLYRGDVAVVYEAMCVSVEWCAVKPDFGRWFMYVAI